MLDAAGVTYRAKPSSVDEAAVKRELGNPVKIANVLACAKALEVSAAESDHWVIGSDSVVSVEGRIFDKPDSRQVAADHLRAFSGRTLELTSAVALARGTGIQWTHGETARLQVRALSERFIADYLDQEWPDVGHCVGVFRMEGRGVQLFERVSGDHFVILGMPLIPLLGALRERGLLPA